MGLWKYMAVQAATDYSKELKITDSKPTLKIPCMPFFCSSGTCEGIQLIPGATVQGD